MSGMPDARTSTGESDNMLTLNIRSYDLDLDTRLSEETTVLVENYTVRHVAIVLCHTLINNHLRAATGRPSYQSWFREV